MEIPSFTPSFEAGTLWNTGIENEHLTPDTPLSAARHNHVGSSAMKNARTGEQNGHETALDDHVSFQPPDDIMGSKNTQSEIEIYSADNAPHTKRRRTAWDMEMGCSYSRIYRGATKVLSKHQNKICDRIQELFSRCSSQPGNDFVHLGDALLEFLSQLSPPLRRVLRNVPLAYQNKSFLTL